MQRNPRRRSKGRRRNPGSADGTAARELELFIVNDGDLYRSQTTPIVKNLAKKMAKGVYDAAKAVKLWCYLADSGAQKYTKEVGDDYGKHRGNGSYGAFNKPTRMAAAKALADEYLEAVKEEAERISGKSYKSNPRRRSMKRRRSKAKKSRRSSTRRRTTSRRRRVVRRSPAKRGTRVKFGRKVVHFKRKVASAATKAKRRAAGRRLARMWTPKERMANLRKAWAANRRRGKRKSTGRKARRTVKRRRVARRR